MRAAQPKGDPYPADPGRPKAYGKLGYNTDVILGRDGKMVGYYRKAWPCCTAPDGSTMDDGYPSRELVKTFDLDFGRVGLQTCFDMVCILALLICFRCDLRMLTTPMLCVEF